MPSKQYTPIQFLNNFINAYLLFRKRLNYQVVVLGGNFQENIVYLIMQRIFSGRRRPIIQIECIWFQSGPLKQFLKKVLFRWLDTITDVYYVYSRMQLTEYPKNFWINKNKVFFLYYHTTIDKTPAEIIQGQYLFSGGNTARDYPTLLEAVKDIDQEVFIACSDSSFLKNSHLPKNVTIESVTHYEFRKLMKNSWINVVPLTKGTGHKAGQQTFLNAMAMGKPVIVTDPEGARDYIESGHDGLLVPPEDPEKLKEAITFLLKDVQNAISIAKKAKERAKYLDTETHLKTIVECAMVLRDYTNKL